MMLLQDIFAERPILDPQVEHNKRRTAISLRGRKIREEKNVFPEFVIRGRQGVRELASFPGS